MTTVEALKDLYVALGGDLADVQDMSTNVAVLNAISAKYEGADNAVLNPEAIANITAVAGNIGGGGESDFSTATMTINGTGEYAADLMISAIVNDALTLYTSPDFGEYQTPLYKGAGMAFYGVLGYDNVSVSGNASVERGVITITGDCTITISSVS